ncbi:MAG: FAD-binding oxidoreductase [Candidatus Lokiarchaeota archaeon]|nr:FAD-binding oxidoreductase [Candidatus Lokiarchaeota archaeon]
MVPEEVIKELEAAVGAGNLSTDDAMLYVYGFDVSDVTGKPDIVVRPGTVEEVAGCVKVCAKHKLPVIPRGAGSGATGGAVAPTGGVVVDLTRMNKILELDLANLQVAVQPGVVIDQLNQALKPHKFCYPVIPGSDKMATMGGVIANDASGMRAFKYGTAKDYVLGATFVMPDGSVVPFGCKALKNVAGLDLLRLFAGSEGTLGIMAEFRVKVLPLPPSRGVLVAYFEDLETAGKAVINTYQAGIVPSAVEIMEKSALEVVNKYRPQAGVKVAEAMLLFELEGDLDFVESQARSIGYVLDALAVGDRQFSADPAEAERLWSARSAVGAATSVLEEGHNRVYEGEDICVPLTEIPRTLRKLRELRDKYRLGTVIFGHISIGSLHPAITIRKSDERDWKAMKELAAEIHAWALSVGGTVTGEHGIGVARKEYMAIMHPGAYEVMKRIKRALDPDNIMNPGKIF